VRFDSQKVGDLQNIQWQVVNYWQQKNKLPQTLDELRNDISGYVSPVDPQSGTAYEYRAMGSTNSPQAGSTGSPQAGDLSFELCAEFNLASSEQGLSYTNTKPRPIDGGGVAESWDHPAGRHCFSRTIDPEFYPPTPLRKPVPVPAIP
jgi:hypothetical protein